MRGLRAVQSWNARGGFAGETQAGLPAGSSYLKYPGLQEKPEKGKRRGDRQPDPDRA
uniref:Uncharacterized protein n=1 Tax=Faecalibaculum rodentium TaxID=1702221 RepID=A0A140DWG4_9FIRM|nr:hypothetical protein AALO17_18570 [Faecalibaculum rodentium]